MILPNVKFEHSCVRVFIVILAGADNLSHVAHCKWSEVRHYCLAYLEITSATAWMPFTAAATDRPPR